MRTVATLAALLSLLLVLDPAMADEEGPALAWASTTRSPQATSPGAHTALYRACGVPDQGLVRLAHAVAARMAAAGPPLAQRELTTWLRQAGLPYVWPRAWGLAGTQSADEERERLLAWVQQTPASGQLRCGIARGSDGQGRPLLTAVVVDALADLAPLPTQTTATRWLALDARTRLRAHNVEVALLGPQGRPKRVLASLSPEGQVRSRFRLDQPGRWLIQVLATTSTGPQPLLETWVFVDTPPALPANPLARAIRPDRTGLRELLARARAKHGLPALRSDQTLQQLAEQHAKAMLQTGRVAHDVGAGGPRERATAHGIASAHLGENVASAPTIARIHQALWQSPTHRENMLDPNFRRVGIAAISDAQGRFWAVQLFSP